MKNLDISLLVLNSKYDLSAFITCMELTVLISKYTLYVKKKEKKKKAMQQTRIS